MPPSESFGRNRQTSAGDGTGARRIRQRGVRLTPQALDLLNRALVQGWQTERREERLTHNARAQLMDVSIVTAKKILAGTPVDRATLAHAFRALGLEWRESYVERSGHEHEPESLEADGSESVGTDAPPDLATSIQPAASPEATPRRLSPLLVAVLVGIVLLAVIGATNFWPNRQGPPPWAKEYDAIVFRALDHYHAARYAESRVDVDRALALARYYDTYRHVPLAMKIAGDLLVVQGRLEEGLRDYEAARVVHQRMGAPPWPELHEAIGLAQVRLGRFAEAERNLRTCLDQYRREYDEVGIALAYRNLGALESARGSFVEADGWFAKSLAEAKRLKKPDIVMDVQGRRGMMLLKQGHPLEARTLLRECLDYWIGKNHRRWIATSEMRLAQTEVQLGLSASALARFQRSRKTFIDIGDRPRVTEVEDYLRQLSPEPSPATRAAEAVNTRLERPARPRVDAPN